MSAAFFFLGSLVPAGALSVAFLFLLFFVDGSPRGFPLPEVVSADGKSGAGAEALDVIRGVSGVRVPESSVSEKKENGLSPDGVADVARVSKRCGNGRIAGVGAKRAGVLALVYTEVISIPVPIAVFAVLAAWAARLSLYGTMVGMKSNFTIDGAVTGPKLRLAPALIPVAEPMKGRRAFMDENCCGAGVRDERGPRTWEATNALGYAGPPPALVSRLVEPEPWPGAGGRGWRTRGAINTELDSGTGAGVSALVGIMPMPPISKLKLSPITVSEPVAALIVSKVVGGTKLRSVHWGMMAPIVGSASATSSLTAVPWSISCKSWCRSGFSSGRDTSSSGVGEGGRGNDTRACAGTVIVLMRSVARLVCCCAGVCDELGWGAEAVRAGVAALSRVGFASTLGPISEPL